MKYLDEYRDPVLARRLLAELRTVATAPWAIMEVCGGQTHTLVRQGIDELLPAGIRMIHGPGCPVCVTPLETIDKAVAIAARPDVVFTSYGDMLRVPGTSGDLLGVKARGGDVRVVYTPLDAVRIARENPDRQVVFFAVGFETTAPANAMAVLHAAAVAFGPTAFAPAFFISSASSRRMNSVVRPRFWSAVPSFVTASPIAFTPPSPYFFFSLPPWVTMSFLLSMTSPLVRCSWRAGAIPSL